MKLDSNRAWQEATAAIGANREVLLALAGVFFLLPSLAFALLFPQPEPPAGATPEQMFNLVGDFYRSALPYMIPMAILQTAGTLAMLTLFTDRSRPTVREAIKLGFAGVLPYIAAQLLIGVGFGLGGGLLLVVAGLTGLQAVEMLVLVTLFLGLAYAVTRLSLVAPVVAVERVLNPIAALTRSWTLTKGNAGRIMAFFLLVIAAGIVITSVVTGLAGIVLALVLGTEGARIVTSVLSSAMGAVFTLYMIGIVAAIHRQLAGPSNEAYGATFE